jgi:AIG2-like family
MASRVRVFFYGSFINREVLAEADLRPRRTEVARLWGFDIRVGPLANVVRSDGDCVYGIVCDATHEELERLYGQNWVGTYHPEAVVVEARDGALHPALCYIAPHGEPTAPAGDYLDRILGPAREHGFPDWYLERLERFRE